MLSERVPIDCVNIMHQTAIEHKHTRSGTNKIEKGNAELKDRYPEKGVASEFRDGKA